MKRFPVVLILSALAFLGIALAQEAKIETTSAIVSSGYVQTETYVMGKDLKSRRCPASFNTYVRVDGRKPDDKNLYYVPPKTFLIPRAGISYSIVCIKEVQ